MLSRLFSSMSNECYDVFKVPPIKVLTPQMTLLKNPWFYVCAHFCSSLNLETKTSSLYLKKLGLFINIYDIFVCDESVILMCLSGNIRLAWLSLVVFFSVKLFVVICKLIII